jgi:hypothetical protein
MTLKLAQNHLKSLTLTTLSNECPLHVKQLLCPLGPVLRLLAGNKEEFCRVFAIFVTIFCWVEGQNLDKLHPFEGETAI